MEATFMPGVTIVDGAIIAAKAVVTDDVEQYTVVGGNPDKKINQRFPGHTIEELLHIQWWDWDMDTAY